MKNKTPVIRIMTNTAALIQQSVSVYAKGLYAIGTSEGEINEDLMDVVTALAGSGPAYVIYYL